MTNRGRGYEILLCAVAFAAFACSADEKELVTVGDGAIGSGLDGGGAGAGGPGPGAGGTRGTVGGAGHSGGGMAGGMDVDAGAGGSGPDVPGLETLRLEPAKRTVRDAGVAPGEITTFKAIGTFASGEEDLTKTVAWSLSEPGLGSLKAGRFTSAGIGGESLVRARASGIEATAMLEVVLDVDTVADGAPDGIRDLFPEDTKGDMVVDDETLRVVYPSHETMFPRNLERVDHQWRADPALDRFEVRFQSPIATVRYYTADRHLLPDLDGWRWIAHTHAGRSLELTVRGVASTAPDMVVRSQSVTLYYSRSEVIGALYYWSTGAQGVMKATISSAVATKFFTDPAGTDTTCVACHTVSRNGRKLSAGYGGERLRAITVPDRSLLIPADPMASGPEYAWGTFDPPADRLLYAAKGVLHMLDANTGAALSPVVLPDMHGATHPDWAPNGKHVAIAYGAEGLGSKGVQGTSVARISQKADGTLGDPEVLLASVDNKSDTLVFPSYTPDSKWIAFARAVGGSKDNETSTLALLPAAGGDPVSLVRLNERVRDEDLVFNVGNNMPTWAPSTEPGVFWIAFTSVRAYGDVLPAGQDQLWAAAIDPAKIGTGEDPSYAAFWLPFQDLAEGNHRAFWAIDTEAECPSDKEICDDLDNDCDGVVDESCCTPKDEVCDGKDNDCDGVKDEGCECSGSEVCDNAKDDDCDGRTDEGCATGGSGGAGGSGGSEPMCPTPLCPSGVQPCGVPCLDPCPTNFMCLGGCCERQVE